MTSQGRARASRVAASLRCSSGSSASSLKTGSTTVSVGAVAIGRGILDWHRGGVKVGGSCSRIARGAQSCYQSAVITLWKGFGPAWMRDGALLVALAAPAVVLAVRGVPAPVTVLFNLGPNDADHIQGFEPHYEIAGPVATRWTTYQPEVNLPLRLGGGPADLSYRFSRVLPETAV